MKLMEAIEAFATNNQRYSTPSGAYLQCDIASYNFCRFVHEVGGLEDADEAYICSYTFWLDQYENIDPELYQYLSTHDTLGNTVCGGHTVVETPDFYVDFTAKQYKSTHAFPLIVHKKAKAATAGGE